MHMRSLLPIVPALVAALLLAIAAPSPALAHSACCSHVHTGGVFDNNSCSVAADCSADWDGLCTEKGLGNPPFYLYCSCVLARAYALAYINAMPALGGTLPAANTTVLYQTAISANSFGGLLFDDAVVSEWAPSAAGPGGIITLSYGVIEDPTDVPVTVDDVTLEFPPGTIAGEASGTITAALPAGSNPVLSYNSVTGDLDMGGLASVDLELTNDVHAAISLRLLWSGEVDGGTGTLTLSLQGTSAALPLPVPAVDWPQWLLLGLVLGASALWFRGRSASD